MKPAFEGVGFAVLFFVAVLLGDELGSQWQDFRLAQCHHGQHQGVVVILGTGGFVSSAKTLFAMDFIGAVKLGAVDGDECSVIQNLKLPVNLRVL